MKCTDEKNISLAERGYKIFFSSTTLTLNSIPIAGLKTNRKPVVGLTIKNCQLFSGRDTPTINQIYKQTLIDTFFQGGGASSIKIETVFFANADKDKPREIIVMTKSMAHSPRFAENDLQGYFYESYVFDNYDINKPPNSLTQLEKLSEKFQEFEGVAKDSKTGRLVRKKIANYKEAKAIRLRLKQLGY